MMSDELKEMYRVYYENVRRCQEMCSHDIVDGYCFLCNKFFDGEENEV